MKRLVRHEVKALDAGGEDGEFEALVAVFGNVDSYGERLVKGAFVDSFEKVGWPRCVWAHQWKIPPIASTLKAEETDDGLLLRCRLFVKQGIELIDHIYLAMQAENGDGLPPLREFSIGYDVVSYEVVKTDEPGNKYGQIVNLTEVLCYEAGPCLVGVNPETELLEVKGVDDTPLIEARPDPAQPEKDLPDREARNRVLTALTGRP